MIVDLADQEPECRAAFDVVVIGAGIAGLLLASKLRYHGLHVAVLESGCRTDSEEVHPLNHVVNFGRPYEGAIRGRARCLGGTSTRWGGAMIPFLEEDLQSRPHVNLPSWPVTMSELSPFVSDVERLFGVDSGPYDDSFLGTRRRYGHTLADDPDFVVRFAKWPTFKRRNVATLLKERLEYDADLTVWLNATATNFNCDVVGGKVESVVARSLNGHKMQISASYFVVCAGAIETTRLLLLLDRQHDNRIFENCNALGRYFHDHISLPTARLRARQVCELNRIAGFRFVGNTMRSLRFELSPKAQADDAVASAFGHISFAAESASGFDALRQSLRSLQRHGHINPSQTLRVLQDVPYLIRASYWRFVRRQLLWPAPAQYQLYTVAEQLPRHASRISLATEVDVFGCAVPAIDWHIGESERVTTQAFVRRFGAFWKRHKLDSIAELEWLIDATSDCIVSREGGGDIFHPGGTTRMGLNSRNAVVDTNLRVMGITNLSVVSSSVFPSGASANPTLMLMLFAFRLAEHLSRQLTR